MGILRLPLAALVAVALLGAGCGEILNEVDKANELAGKPSGNRPAGPAPGEKAAPKAEAEGPGLVDRVQGLLGWKEPGEGGRRPPDPNDPMVLCKLNGSTGYMLKSGCVNRRGTVLASKGVPR